jgi:hypothetical protein
MAFRRQYIKSVSRIPLHFLGDDTYTGPYLPAGCRCPALISLSAIPRPKRIIVTFPLRSGRSAVGTNPLESASDLSYLAFGTFTKRATPWLWNATPVFVLSIYVARWGDTQPRFNGYRV